MTFDFRDLFIFEMANNHQGSVAHGERIIQEMGQIAKAKGIRAAIKFQFRDLDTFIHRTYGGSGMPSKHIKRFQDTRLTEEDFESLVEEVRKNDLITMATPFDEPSVGLIEELGIEVVKIGSCSAQDWPLLEEVAGLGKPVIFSTGGLNMKEIDDLVSFFDHRGVHHAIMHCVAIYPTPYDKFQLNQIGALCRRYPNKVIGLSSHESRWQTSPISIAVAQGARIFERHVGAEDKPSVEYGGTPSGITLNAYSADAEAIEGWLADYKTAREMCGATERPESPPEEQAALQELKRGVYAKYDFGAHATLGPAAVYFAMPCVPGQLTAGEWKDGGTTIRPIGQNDAIMRADYHMALDPMSQILYTTVHTIKGMLAEAKIALPPDFKLEFSHHKGLVMFPQVGATIIEIVNREYCKKLIILTPGQLHPEHYHVKKEETFQVLSGELHIVINQRALTLYPGDTALIRSGEFHSFWTDAGAIIEEISTTHYKDDSFYADPLITALKREDRKTIVEHWGRFQGGR